MRLVKVTCNMQSDVSLIYDRWHRSICTYFLTKVPFEILSLRYARTYTRHKMIKRQALQNLGRDLAGYDTVRDGEELWSFEEHITCNNEYVIPMNPSFMPQIDPSVKLLLKR